MRVCIAPDIFQDRMSSLFDYLEAARVYIDDLLIVTFDTFEEHLLDVEKVMHILEKVGLKCKIHKCKFAVTEAEYLGYIITREGV